LPVVEFESTDKALTIRNRIKKTMTTLALEDATIRRRGGRIVIYREPEEADS
jgi:hypothetical protein